MRLDMGTARASFASFHTLMDERTNGSRSSRGGQEARVDSEEEMKTAEGDSAAIPQRGR